MSEEKKRKLPDPRGFQPLWPSTFETPKFRDKRSGRFIPERAMLLLYLALNANREDKTWRGILVKRGQILTSLSTLDEGSREGKDRFHGFRWGRDAIRHHLRELSAVRSVDHTTVCPHDSPQRLYLITVRGYEKWSLLRDRFFEAFAANSPRCGPWTNPIPSDTPEIPEIPEKEKDRREQPKTAPRRRHKWTEEEIENVVTVSTPQEALAFFVEWGWKELPRLRSEGKAVPLEPKASGGRAIKTAERLLNRWGGGHYVRLVVSYYRTAFSEWEAAQAEGFPSLSHFERVENIVNERDGRTEGPQGSPGNATGLPSSPVPIPLRPLPRLKPKKDSTDA